MFLVLFSSAVWAWESVPQPVVLEDEVAFFEGLEIDSGWLPSSGLLGIMLGVFFLVFSFDITESFIQDKHDPGPRYLPMILGCLLLLGGGSSAIAKLLAKRKRQSLRIDPKAVMIFVFTALYILALPFLGFHISTAMFAIFSMLCLGVSPRTSIISAAVVIISVHYIFLVLFSISFSS